jgi:hypothetical protein
MPTAPFGQSQLRSRPDTPHAVDELSDEHASSPITRKTSTTLEHRILNGRLLDTPRNLARGNHVWSPAGLEHPLRCSASSRLARRAYASGLALLVSCLFLRACVDR